uniref:Sulfurtransferase n=1 Tax=Urechis unicinctus TaxID=6432 RepID=I3PG25_UREUN|nr:thiosulfate sulfurtransferase [Urechis unicinctus]
MMKQVLARVNPLVTTKWLASRVLRKVQDGPRCNIRVLDGSLLPGVHQGARDAFDKRHIPEAQFFDVNECCDKSSHLMTTIPKPRVFEDYVGNLGISNKTHVIIYDNTPGCAGVFSAPRVWWMFKYYGHSAASVLNGGLPKWLKEGLPTTSDHQPAAPEIFKAKIVPKFLTEFEDMEKLVKENNKCPPIVDVRPAPEFANHIKGSVNIPLPLLPDPATGEVRSPDELKQIFSNNGVDIRKSFVATCEVGVTACAAVLLARLFDNNGVTVYDGSWQEWDAKASSELSTRAS